MMINLFAHDAISYGCCM